MRRWIVVAALVLGIGGAILQPWAPTHAVAQGAAPQPPPPPQVESPGPPPNPNAVWVSGHWLWQGGKYQWVQGRWETAPAGASAYVPGRHKQTGQGWVWEPGRWRK
jgi:hypothetical protein